ncbi:MAG: redoxin domain-containing protein [bacterium]
MRTVALVVLTAAVVGLGLATPALEASGRRAPDFVGGGPWFNTVAGKPLTIAGLRGKVVAVEMWTAGCYNCRNVIPDLKKWHARYHDKGLVIVGVHSPEFSYERLEPYVRKAIATLGLEYAVVMDNGFRIWRAYNNVYWPTIYLVDKKGLIRYKHIGEGAYDETERVIKELLAES